MQLAWQIARLVRTEKFPVDSAKLLMDEDPSGKGVERTQRRRQSLREMKQAAFLLTLANGGRVGPEAKRRLNG